MGNTDFVRLCKEKMKDIVLVDLSWVLYRSYFSFPQGKFVAPNGHPNGHLFGLVKLIQTLDRMGFLVFLCEDGKCEYRKNLNEHYKEGRTSQGFYKDYDLIHSLVNDLDNVYCLSNKEMEADDIIYSASMLVDDNTYCYIHSADNDLYQCLKRPNVRISKSIKYGDISSITSTSPEYTDKYPVPPRLLPMYRALRGDSSDNLPPPVPRLPKKLIVRLCDFFDKDEDSIYAAFNKFVFEKESERRWINLLKENFGSFTLNYKMMKLDVIDFDIVHKVDKGNSSSIAQEYGLYQYSNYLILKSNNVELI